MHDPVAHGAFPVLLAVAEALASTLLMLAAYLMSGGRL